MHAGSYGAIDRLPGVSVTDGRTFAAAKQPPSQPDEGKQQRNLQGSCEAID